MKYTTAFITLATILAASVSSAPLTTRDVDPSLIPQLGFTAGKNPTGTGLCDGATNGPDGKPGKVPCNCPPSQDDFNRAFIANVNAGHAIHNPSVAVSCTADDKRACLHAATVTLQNLEGPGKGCPQGSTTLTAQADALG